MKEKSPQTRVNVSMGMDTYKELTERIPAKERSKFIESLIRKSLGMPDRPDYHVGRPRNSEQ